MPITTIVLLPETIKEFLNLFLALPDSSDQFGYEVVAVFPKLSEDERATLNNLVVTYAEVPFSLSFGQKANIARNLSSLDSKYLLFLDKNSPVSEKWLKDRVHAFEVEKTIGIIGKLGPVVSAENERKLFQRLIRFVHINQQDFKSKCCLPDGTIRQVEPETMSTTTALWDMLGGLAVSGDLPVVEYCVRAQSIGYGILPQPK
jgi:hypothetical protein